MTITEAARKMRQVSLELASSQIEKRNKALSLLAESLSENKEEIFSANRRDMEEAEKGNISPAIKKRLKYDEGKLKDSIEGLKGLEGLSDPIGHISLHRELDKDLVLKRIGVPIGVIGVIFEARPDAMIQVASLCIKSGNCAVLKGGKETKETNRVLFSLIVKAATEAGLPEGCLFQAETHSDIDELLSCDKYVDLLIPRGSNNFVRHIMENTKIPVMGHSSGVCHIYVDKDADRELAIKVIIDAKTQYAAACNAVETVLVSEEIADEFIPELAEALSEAGVKLRGTKVVVSLLGDNRTGSKPDSAVVSGEGEARSEETSPIITEMSDEEFSTEYGDFTVSLKTVKDVKEAVEHINTYGSHHTDCIITKNDDTAAYFERMTDSAGVYRNCSTRFADGFRYGFGAEVGISTGKIHARGPVGLEGLLTYKYILEGNGNIVADYASGARHFTHRNINNDRDE